MRDASPPARVAAFVHVARLRNTPDVIDALAAGPTPKKRLELRLTHLSGLLDRLAEVCPDHLTCEQCGEAICEECGLGEVAPCPGDGVHCASPWCWDQACVDAHREDEAAEAAREVF